MICGVYCITHVLTGRKYVGQSVDIERRLGEHASGRGRCRRIQGAIRKYGWSAFATQVLEACRDQTHAIEREPHWIAELGTLSPGGFNLTTGGEGNEVSEETRKRASESMRTARARQTPEQRREIARKAVAAQTPEQRSEKARRANAALTAEQRSEIKRRTNAARTSEQRSETARKVNAAQTFEQRSEVRRRMHAARTPEQRSETIRKANAALTPEQRSEIRRKAWITRRARAAEQPS